MAGSLPIYLDRLQRELEKRSFAIKRSEVLEVAAAAFGYHSPNEMTAAADRGALDPPIARVTTLLYAENGMVTLLDPVAGRAYAVEADALKGPDVSFGVTPYGSLVDLRGVVARPIEIPDVKAVGDAVMKLAATSRLKPFAEDVVAEAVALASDVHALRCLYLPLRDAREIPCVTDAFELAMRLTRWRDDVDLEDGPEAPGSCNERYASMVQDIIRTMVSDGIPRLVIETNGVVGRYLDARDERTVGVVGPRMAEYVISTAYNMADVSDGTYRHDRFQEAVFTRTILPDGVARIVIARGPLQGSGQYMTVALEALNADEGAMVRRILDGSNKASFFTDDGAALSGPRVHWHQGRNWCSYVVSLPDRPEMRRGADVEAFVAMRESRLRAFGGRLLDLRSGMDRQGLLALVPLEYLAARPFEEWASRMREALG